MIPTLEAVGAQRLIVWTERELGLRAFLVIDDLTLGPGAGGIRTWRYDSPEAAVLDAARLARTMTIKNSLAGLSAGGAKAVVMDHEGLDRVRAFDVLGARIDELGGLFRTAGDLGTRAEDLERVRARTSFVHTNELGLSRAVARGVLRTIEACASLRERAPKGLRVAVQGAGAIGAAVVEQLCARGMDVRVADLDAERARTVAQQHGATACDASGVLLEDVDVISPCAIGGVVTPALVAQMSAWAICGAANNLLAPGASSALRDRQVMYVPDAIASAGAVIDGIGESVMKLDTPKRDALVDALGATAKTVLEASAQSGRSTTEVAEDRAWARIESAGGVRPAP